MNRRSRRDGGGRVEKFIPCCTCAWCRHLSCFFFVLLGMFSVDYALWPFLPLWENSPPARVAFAFVAFLSRTAHSTQHTVHSAQWNAALKLLAWLTHTLERVTPAHPQTHPLGPYLWLPALIVGLPFGYRLISISIVLLYFCFCFLAAFQFDRLMRQLQKAAQLIRRHIRGHMYPTYLIYRLHIPCTYVLFLYLYIFMTFWAF